MICVFCLFTRVYLQYYCICLQQYWRLVLQLIFNNFAIWCKIFAIENLFFNPITKKLQSSTTPILDFKQQLPFLAGHGTWTHDPWVASPVPYPFLHEISYWNSWKITYINTYQTFVVWYKIFAIENLFFNPDAKYLHLKIYFSIQMQKNCKLVIGIQDFAKNYAKKLQTFCKIRVETQNINKWILIEILLQKHCISIKNICILQRFSPQCTYGHPMYKVDIVDVGWQ